LITPINLRIESYDLLLPPESRESQYLRYVFELQALLEPLALPRGIDPPVSALEKATKQLFS
jgi:hypothetical protein